MSAVGKSAISKITSTNNLSVSKKLTDSLGWLPNDQILETVVGENIHLSNLTLNTWKNDEDQSKLNEFLYTTFDEYEGKYIFLVKNIILKPGHSATFFKDLIINFNKQFKGKFSYGQIAPADSLSSYNDLLLSQNISNPSAGNKEISLELQRFYNQRDLDALTFINFNMFSVNIDYNSSQEIKNEFHASISSNNPSKFVLFGILSDYKKVSQILDEFKLQDALVIDLSPNQLTYTKIIKGVWGDNQKIQYK